MVFSLPQLLEEDIAAFDAALDDFIARSRSKAALVIDQGGFVVAQKGDLDGLDTATLGALAANSFAATRALAGLINETSVSSVYQEGEEHSALILSLEPHGYFVVIFRAELGVGSVKYYTDSALQQVRAQFSRAQERAPESGFDLAELNLADTAPIFKRR